MTTYATLKSDIASWFIDEDLTSVIPSLVRNCEAALRRSLKVRAMEVTGTLDVSGASTALPDGFLSMRSLTRQGVDRRLDYLSPERLREGDEWDSSGEILAYTIEGENLIVAPAPTQTVMLDIVYVKALDPLSGDSDTNWVLTNAYDVYLFGCLEQAAIYAEDVELEQKFGARFAGVVESLNREQALSRMGGSARVKRGVNTP